MDLVLFWFAFLIIPVVEFVPWTEYQALLYKITIDWQFKDNPQELVLRQKWRSTGANGGADLVFSVSDEEAQYTPPLYTWQC